MPATILKTHKRRHLRERALRHVARHHQQLINAVTIQISLLDNTPGEVSIDIGDELLSGKDRHALRAKIISMRRVTLADVDNVERLCLPRRGETSRFNVADQSGGSPGSRAIKDFSRRGSTRAGPEELLLDLAHCGRFGRNRVAGDRGREKMARLNGAANPPSGLEKPGGNPAFFRPFLLSIREHYRK